MGGHASPCPPGTILQTTPAFPLLLKAELWERWKKGEAISHTLVSDIPLAMGSFRLLTLILLLGLPPLLLAQSTPEYFLRQKARHVVMPHYPENSISNETSGVAVVSLLVDKQGKTAETEVLQAPDDKIAESVVHAVLQWTFEPTVNHRGELIQVRSKLTFYFVLNEDGGALVLNPGDMRNLPRP